MNECDQEAEQRSGCGDMQVEQWRESCMWERESYIRYVHWLLVVVHLVIAFVSSCYCYCYCVCACVQCARARVCVCDVRWLLFVFLCRLHIYSFLLFLSCCILNANKVYYIHRRLRLQGFYVAAAHANQKTAGIINNGARLPAVANLIICAFHRFHDVVRPSYYQSRSHCVLFTYLLIS